MLKAILQTTIDITWKLVIWLYSILFTLYLPFLFFGLYLKSRKNPGYRHRWLERLGVFSPPDKTKGLWVHAVSVGETVAAAPLILAFQKQFPDISITVTTTTPTGSARVKSLFPDSVFHIYFPYDLPWTMQFFLKRIQPKVAVFMETELWPNTFTSLKRWNIPCIIANGRLSLRSMKSYQKISLFTQKMFKNIFHVAAQSKNDREHFLGLGLDQERSSVMGNIKFDVLMPPITDASRNLRLQWGENRPVWIAASTHAGEETDLLWVFSELKKEFSDLLFILVPRHPERFQTVADEIEKHGFQYCRRTASELCCPKTEILLGDTMGEMAFLYGASSIAFVGGSLVSTGGHNVLEPAALGLPIVVGPYTHNFTEITQLLKDAGALVQVNTKEALKEELLACLTMWKKDRAGLEQRGMKGKQVVLENRGAVERVLKIIAPFFS